MTSLLQIYKACHSERFLQIFSLMYRESTEESRYLTALKNETDAFESLFREKEVAVARACGTKEVCTSGLSFRL